MTPSLIVHPLRIRMSAVNRTEPAILNVAAYRFVRLESLTERREELRTLTRELGLKGTILLAPEGINLFVAGREEAVETFLERLQSDPCFTEIDLKRSYSSRQPFERMLVKLKREIIPLGRPAIDPTRASAPRVAPETLRDWLREKREVTLLDTRNDYEVEFGTFEDAVPIGIGHFREFAEAAMRLPEGWKRRPIVTFCTGGIRCEKAAPLLQSMGFQEVYQLDGGILRYFEECGGEFYHGDCFVFDQRIALDAGLREIDPD